MAKILVLSATPDPFSEDHGGKQRLVNSLMALTEEHQVTLLSLSWMRQEFEKEISKNLKQISIPVEESIIRATKTKKFNLRNPSQDVMIAYYKKYFKKYQMIMNKLAINSDLIIVDHYATAPMLDFLNNKKIPILYSSQNCESDLVEQIYTQNSEDFNLVYTVEKNIINKSTSLAYCSRDDLHKMQDYFDINAKTYYIPNGTTIPKNIKPGQNIKSKNIIFIGSGHPPNTVAAENIIKLAKIVPQYNFVIAGKCVAGIDHLKIPQNVIKIKNINNKEVEDLFSYAFAFINPMESGSGTHLKMMKALGYSLPIISSEVGARGFSDEEIKNCMLIGNNTEELSFAIKELENKDKYVQLSKNSNALSKEYDWEKIKKDFLKAVNETLLKPTTRKIIKNAKPKILVYSIIRNEARYFKTFYNQLKNMVDGFPEYEFYLSLYENDSDDGTKQELFSKDWSFFAGVSIISENLFTKNYGSVKDGERVKNLSIARNKAIEASNFLEFADYVMMVESDMEFSNDVVGKILNFKNIEPDFDIVSGFTIRNGTLYDQWATRKTPHYIPRVNGVDADYKDREYEKYYSTSNGICLYRAEPFREGVRYGWINTVTGEPDCDTVVVCQNFHALGYNNIYILHHAEIYHEHK